MAPDDRKIKCTTPKMQNVIRHPKHLNGQTALKANKKKDQKLSQPEKKRNRKQITIMYHNNNILAVTIATLYVCAQFLCAKLTNIINNLISA